MYNPLTGQPIAYARDVLAEKVFPYSHIRVDLSIIDGTDPHFVVWAGRVRRSSGTLLGRAVAAVEKWGTRPDTDGERCGVRNDSVDVAEEFARLQTRATAGEKSLTFVEYQAEVAANEVRNAYARAHWARQGVETITFGGAVVKLVERGHTTVVEFVNGVRRSNVGALNLLEDA